LDKAKATQYYQDKADAATRQIGGLRAKHVARDAAQVPAGPKSSLKARADTRKEHYLQILVRDNNVDQALRVLKKKMQREGVFREMKRRRFYEKPSEVRVREKAEAVRRVRKLARKQAQREGLIADPRKKKLDAAKARGQRTGARVPAAR
jgi:small subunit ribosomal protein S21